VGGLGIGTFLVKLISLLLPKRRPPSLTAVPHAAAWSHPGSTEYPQAWTQPSQRALGDASSATPCITGPGASSVEAAAATTGAEYRERLDELTASVRKHVEETRDATTSLRRVMEQQQRQYQAAVNEFQRSVEQQARKPVSSTQRVEISESSMQVLKSLIGTSEGRRTNGVASFPTGPGVAASTSEAHRQWFGSVEQNLVNLLRAAPGRAEARRSLQTVSMIVHNLVTSPTQERYREVNTSSARFRETFGGSDSAAGLLQLAGFEFRDPSFIFPIEKGLDEAERVRDLLQEALRDSDRRWAEACGVTDSVEVPNGQNGKSGGEESRLAQSPAPGSDTETTVPVGCSSSSASGSGAPQAEAQPKPVPAAAPWFSSVVQKQLSRVPAEE